MTTTTGATLAQKFNAIEDSMALRLVERPVQISTSVTALVGQLHWFGLGAPGTGKSKLVRDLVKHVSGWPDGAYFERAINAFSTPEMLEGVMSLAAMREDRFFRQTRGMLPEAYIAFLDEIFKAGPALLNTLLSLMNEGIYYNEGPVAAPLTSLFCASNERPRGDELVAMEDRLHFRHLMRPISEMSNFILMLKMQTAGPIVPLVSFDELKQAQLDVTKVEIPEEIFEAIAQLRLDLRREGVTPTDRRFAQSLRIVRATAWLEGRYVAEMDDIRRLAHSLWTDPSEITPVTRCVLQLANPLDKEAMELLDQVEKLWVEFEDLKRDVDPGNKVQRNQVGIGIHNRIEDATTEYESLLARSKQSTRRNETIASLHGRLEGLTRELMGLMFSMDPKSINLPS